MIRISKDDSEGESNAIIISDDDDDEDDDKPAARGETGRPWWMSPSAGLFGDGPAPNPPSSIWTGPPSDADIYEGRVLHLRYMYQMTMEQRIRLIIKEIMQGMLIYFYIFKHPSV